jgi:hypothetical protein
MASDIRLTWDLFIIVFFGIVITYSFILGRNHTLKVIIAVYMASLTADGLGNLFNTYLLPAAPTLQGATGDQALVLLKIFVFVLVIVLLAIKGGFHVDILRDVSIVNRVLSNLSFGFLNAGLMVSTLLVYLTGGSFVSGNSASAATTNLYQESQFVQLIVDNSSIWFALPAIAIVIVSFFEPRQD